MRPATLGRRASEENRRRRAKPNCVDMVDEDWSIYIYIYTLVKRRSTPRSIPPPPPGPRCPSGPVKGPVTPAQPAKSSDSSVFDMSLTSVGQQAFDQRLTSV